MNTKNCHNNSQLRVSVLYAPLFVLLCIFLFLYQQDALSPERYVEIQRDTFLWLNEELSQYPVFQYNITQLGDAFVMLSTLSFLLFYRPKLWESLISASLISLIFSQGLKNIFDIPRPATIWGYELFNIIGEPAVGYSSFPSGHSITIFTAMSVLIFVFISKNKSLTHNLLQTLIFFIVGFLVAFSRVGVGAHYPIDVITGSTLGYLAGALGILMNQKCRLWKWISEPQYYPFFIILFLGSLVFMGYKMTLEALPIFYIPVCSLIISLYLMIQSYVKFIKK